MELKVLVEGVVRVVCGLSLNTSCQDVVIALAQSLSQTGRYILIVKLRGKERQLVADDCPLQHLSQLGRLAAEVQFVLRRTGPSRSDGQDHQEPEPHSLGSSTHPKRTEPNRVRSPSPRASPEPRASPVSFLDPHNSPKEEVFRQILQQQRRLQDLGIQLQSLEREAEVWERERSSAEVPGLSPVAEGELEELEQRLRQTEADLMIRNKWEEELQAEMDREEDMHGRLQQLHSSMDDHGHQIEELQARSAQLERDVQLGAHRQSSRADTRQPEEALRPLKQELHYRRQQGEDLEAALSGTQRDLQTKEEKLQGRQEMIEELNKELRQCKLQQFILQTGGPDQINLPVTDVYLSNAGIME
ncbi:ras association domain-containing protein 7-like isoform X1 [Anarrhichthys ocellatus]|uniref:ras association domain-containing protein 7-like isoform X1 n=1 Tax=Anarrhichthys ocellatus TaxID=433405 RepID=UPI0012EE5EEC|nr:ras association domain-containing protein 7-like isoform X1 [Anarrhichthys ocellatus]XP_031734925.1 ras association domain-containing protein 7-like isoform X1 [Anarrhichthys ocellatus]